MTRKETECIPHVAYYVGPRSVGRACVKDGDQSRTLVSAKKYVAYSTVCTNYFLCSLVTRSVFKKREHIECNKLCIVALE